MVLARRVRLCGCRGVLRGTDGEWLNEFARSVGLCKAYIVGLWGVLEGLKFVGASSCM